MQKNNKQQSRLWDYVIQHKIGKGQYGQVFKVQNKSNRSYFALKKMSLTGIQQRQKKQIFRQIKCLKLLSHPSIIEYEQSFLSPDNIYIVMQYAAKGDLYKIIKQRRKKQKYFTEEQLWKMFQAITKGVKYLHEKNIIHRDLKLQNIFLTQKDQVKIGDLGMSKILTKQSDMISTRVGTPIYFAPQMIRNQLYSFPVDIWALGCIFYNIAMLQHPFQQASLQTLALYIIDKDPKPIKGQYSVQIINFINSCLTKQVSKRPNIYELALNIKNRCSFNLTKRNKISIFSLRQLTKIINADSYMIDKIKKEQLKYKQKYTDVNIKLSQSALINYNCNSPRKIHTSLYQRPKHQHRNLRSSVDNSNYEDLKNPKTIENMSPQSPTYLNNKFRRISLMNNNNNNNENKIKHLDMKKLTIFSKSITPNQQAHSPMIKSKGFNIINVQSFDNIIHQDKKIEIDNFNINMEVSPENIYRKSGRKLHK